MPRTPFFEFFFEFVFELLPDIGALRPFPEFVFQGLFVPGGLESQALLFDGDTAGVKVPAPQGNDVGGDVAEVAEVGFGFIVRRGEGVGGGGEAKSDPLNEFVGEAGGGAGVGGFGGGEVFGGKGKGVLSILPEAEAVLGILIEVLFGNGHTVEFGSHLGLNLGQRIEPRQDAVVAFGVVEAAVELFADGFGEMSDFAVHKFRNI